MRHATEVFSAANGRTVTPPVVFDETASGRPGTEVRKVLVVDDEPDLADVAELLLRAHGLEVCVAYSAREALLRLQDDPAIDAIFSDIMMPEMTGLQLAGIVQHTYPEIRIILTSGYIFPELLGGLQASMLFVAKPYSVEKVIKLLRD